MAKETKYSVRDLKQDFPTDKACLAFIYKAQHSDKCSCGGQYSLIKGRRQYQCSKCRFQIAPTAGTIFHKSDTPLTLWFQALLLFSNSKSGLSAKQLERQLGVTYKCAWRMLMLIRKALKQSGSKLSGDVEIDSAYFGGVYPSGKYNKKQKEAIAAKSVVIGAVERGGQIRAKVTKGNTAKDHGQFLKKNIAQAGTRLLSDKTNRLTSVAKGYDRHSVDHHLGEYVRGDIHVNNVETFWSHTKRSIKGVHKVISKKYLQSYLDGFVFHYNNRRNDRERWSALLGALLPA